MKKYPSITECVIRAIAKHIREKGPSVPMSMQAIASAHPRYKLSGTALRKFRELRKRCLMLRGMNGAEYDHGSYYLSRQFQNYILYLESRLP